MEYRSKNVISVELRSGEAGSTEKQYHKNIKASLHYEYFLV